MDGVWLAMLALAINFWESSAITNKNNRGSKVQEEPVRNFRHVENPTAYSNSDWEVGLRESTNQALLRENYHAPNLRDHLFSAPLIGKHDTATPFGDVAVIARGRLYATIGGDFVFVQEPYHAGCHACRRHRRRCARGRCHEQVANPYQDKQLVALWTVKRLRHRDYVNGYRYETEYTISPVGSLYNDAFVPESNPLDYPIPGHVFVVKHSAGTPAPVPPPVIYNQRAPHHHFRPEVPIGVGPDGDEHFLLSYPGFYTSTPFHPTFQSTEDPKQVELYKILVEALAMKTSTTHKIEDGPHRFSLNNLYTTEDSFTPLVQLPTGEMVPLTSATSHVTDTPQSSNDPILFTSQDTVTIPPSLQVAPAAPTDLSPMEVTKGKDDSTITTVHYFAAADEEHATRDETEKSTSTVKPSTQHVDDGADFLFPLEMTTATQKMTNTLYNPDTQSTKSKTDTEIFPEQSAAPTRQSKLYHATFSANKNPVTTNFSPATTTQTTSTSETLKTTSATSSETSPTPVTSKAAPTMISETTPTTTTSRTTPTTISETSPTTTSSTTPTTISETTPTTATSRTTPTTISETTPTTTTSRTTPTTISETTSTTTTSRTTPTTISETMPTTTTAKTTPPATLATTSVRPTANGISRTIKLPPPTNLILKSSTVSKSDTPTTYRTKFTGPNGSARFFPPTFKLITTKQTTEGSTTSSTIIITTPTTAITPSTIESTTIPAPLSKNSTTNTETMTQTAAMSSTYSTMTTGNGENDKESTNTTSQPTEKSNLMTTATIIQTSEYAMTEPTSIKTSTEDEDMAEMKFVLNPIPITPVKMTLVPESTVTTQIQSITDLQTTKDLTGTTANKTEERKTTQMMSTPDFTTFKTVMTSITPTTEAFSVVTTTERTENTVGVASTASTIMTTDTSSTTTENTMVRMFNDFLNENKDDTSPTIEETETTGLTNTVSTAMPTNASSTTAEENIMLKMFHDFLKENNTDTSSTREGTEKTTGGTGTVSTVMTTNASSTTTEENTMLNVFNNFLDEYRMKKRVNKKPAKTDYSYDDIFGTVKESEKPTATTTVKTIESQFAGELFGNRRRSPKTYPIDSPLTKPTKIIYSDFYEASAAPVTDKQEELLADDKPLTSQSYMTSISFKVNKKTKIDDVGQETGIVTTTESGMDDRETRKALNDAALQLVNHVRSINYLNRADSSMPRAKYKRRRTYVPKSRKVNIKRKI